MLAQKMFFRRRNESYSKHTVYSLKHVRASLKTILTLFEAAGEKINLRKTVLSVSDVSGMRVPLICCGLTSGQVFSFSEQQHQLSHYLMYHISSCEKYIRFSAFLFSFKTMPKFSHASVRHVVLTQGWRKKNRCVSVCSVCFIYQSCIPNVAGVCEGPAGGVKHHHLPPAHRHPQLT